MLNAYFQELKERITAVVSVRLTHAGKESVEVLAIVEKIDWDLDSISEEHDDFQNIEKETVASVLSYRLDVLNADHTLYLQWIPDIVPEMVASDELFPAPQIDADNVDWSTRYYDLGEELMDNPNMVVHTDCLFMADSRNHPTLADIIKDEPFDLDPSGEQASYAELTCSICGVFERVSTDDHGDWMPDVYLRDEEIGTVCPGCQAYCEQESDGVAVVKLERVDWSKATALKELIEKRFVKE